MADPTETPEQAKARHDADLQAYWKEDAERVNALGEAAANAGIKIGTAVKPPALKPGGSLADQQ